MMQAENPSAGSREVGRAYSSPSTEPRIDPLRVLVWGGLLLLVPFIWALIAAGLIALL